MARAIGWMTAAILLRATGDAGGQTNWTNATGNGLWGDAANWSAGVPTPGTDAGLHLPGSHVVDLGNAIRPAETVLLGGGIESDFTLINGTLDTHSIDAGGRVDVASALTSTTAGAVSLGGNVRVSGSIIGPVDLTLGGSGAFPLFGEVTLAGPNTYTGATRVTGGALTIAGGGSILNSPLVRITPGGVLRLEESPGTAGRIGNSAVVEMSGGTFMETTAGEETLGTLRFAQGRSVFSVASGRVRATTLERRRGAIVNFDTATPASGRLRLINVPPFPGDDTAPTRRNVAAWGTGRIGTVAAPDVTLMTYDRGPSPSDPSDDVGFRPLNAASEFSATLADGENVRLVADAQAAGPVAPNALVLKGAAVSLDGGDMTLGSGALMFLPGATRAASIRGAGAGAGGALVAPDELIVHAFRFDGGHNNGIGSPTFAVDVPIVAHSITKSGDATVTLSRANAHTGGTVINGGALAVTTLAALGSGTVTLAGGSLLLPAGSSVIPNALRVEPPADSLSTVTASPGSTTTFTGLISGDGGLARFDGGGTFLFTGAGAPTGAYQLRIHTGTIILDGDLASPDSHISTPGTTMPWIGGEGAVRGLFRPVRADFSPGALGGGDVGRFTAGNVECYGVNFRFDLAGADAGAEYDQLVALDRLFLSPSSVNDNALFVTLVGGFTPALGQQFTLIDDRFAGPVAGAFRGLAEGGVFSAGGIAFRISYVGGDGNDVVITVVPEPLSTGACGFAFAAASMIARQRRRRRRRRRSGCP